MSTLDQTHDRDPFALGGRTAGEPAGDEKIFALIAEFRRVDKEYGRAHAKAESLEGQEGGDTAFAAVDELTARLDGMIEELTDTFPTTLAGADAVREFAETCLREEVDDHVVDCYRHLATAARPAREHEHAQSPCPPLDDGFTPLFGDAEFIETESEIARLYRECGLRADRSDEASKPYYDRIEVLEHSIAQSAPTSLVSAAVKLRRLLDPEVGMPIGEGEDDFPSLHQVLAFIETAAKGGAA